MGFRFLLYLPRESYSPKGLYLAGIPAPITFAYGSGALTNGLRAFATYATTALYPIRLTHDRHYYNYYE